MSTPVEEAISPEPPRHGRRAKMRFLLAAVSVVLLSGGATAVLALNEVGKLVDALSQSRAVSIAPHVLAAAGNGAPETLLLVGNDQRPPPKNNPGGFVLPHSNEMLLVRIDPSRPTISMLSIPRELQVTIRPPGQRPKVTRINAAYTIGGIQLMTETIKRVLGVAVNHVFVVTFPKFQRAVDEMGCVFMTVDRRYLHHNEPGGEQYFEINLQPGYQRICGRQALEFVANRHEDTSLVRDARDQRFLLEVKEQFGATLFENRGRFERILGRAVETDLHGSGAVLDLLKLLVQSQGKPVRQAHFQVNLLPAYDTATPQQIHESVQSLLTGTAPISRHRLNAVVHAARGRQSSTAGAAALTPTTSSELDRARSAAPNLPFVLEYPRRRASGAGARPDTLRLYRIRDQQGQVHPAYVVSIDRGGLGEFYDVQGTTWSDPPLLSNPSQEAHVGTRTYGLFYTGEQIKVLAWHENGAVYWIQNTLTNSLSPQTMLAIAAQTVPVVSSTGPGIPPAPPVPHTFALPPRAPAAAGVGYEIGAALGLLGLLVVGGLAVLLLARQRELEVLRGQIAQAMVIEARQRPLLVAAGVASGAPEMPMASPATGASPTAPTGAAQSPTGGPTIYRARRRIRSGALGAAVVAIAGLVLLGVGVLGSGSSGGGSTVPVAVFNATTSPGAAKRIAAQLRRDHVHVSQIGDIKTNLGAGAFVFYPPHSEQQAQHLATLLSGLSPTVAAIPPQTQSVIGHPGEIVIVLD